MKAWSQFIQYIQDAIVRIFSPSKDDYPKAGEQPYTGEPNQTS